VQSFDKPIRPVLTDMLHETMDIDGRLLHTLKTLLLKPGLLSLEYRNGRRTRYTPPLRMYLVISILFFLLISVLGFGGSFDASTGASNSGGQAEHYPKLMFLLLPLFALILQLLFRGTFYLSNLVFAIHIHCFAYLVFAVIVPMEAYENSYPLLVILQVPFVIYMLSYMVLALKRYYAESWTSVLLKFLVLLFVYSGAMGLGFDFFLPLTV
jgi:hypothetical protein